jgi:para-nitrobenzyl esterase
MSDLIVETRQGAVCGARNGAVASWKGIPYAAPPVGPLRFRPPVPAVAWSGVRDATAFGAASIQTRDPRMAALSGVSDKFATSEDCLVLNVYAPAEPAAGPLPVMVWIHGGAFAMGSGSTPLYNAQAFVERGVIVVTLNYRLGLAGLLFLGDLAPDYENGNCALLDQVAALGWVRDNIAAFGGDPSQVTAMGESAGAISIALLLAMPAARGLIHRAILESGAGVMQPVTRDAATRLARQVLDELGVTVDGLADLPIERLLAVQEARSQSRGIGALSPYVDGVHVPSAALEVARAGGMAGVPLLIGTNRDEWTLFAVLIGYHTVEVFKAPLRNRLGDRADAFVEAYRQARADQSEPRAWVDIVSDLVFRIPVIRLAEAQAGHATPVYVYRFDWPSTAFGGQLGAAHALELPFVWNRLDLPNMALLLGPDLAKAQPIATAMHNTWVAFIKSGDPNGAGLPAWPRYDAERRPTLLIDHTSRVVDDPGGELRALWPDPL